MAMMISRFHKLIQSRVIWGIILAIVVLTFVVWGVAPAVFGRGMDRETDTAGKIHGRKVSGALLWNAQNKVFLDLLLSGQAGMMRSMLGDNGFQALLRQEAWTRMVDLDAAQRMGLAVSNAEVQAAIAGDPMLQTNGQYDEQKYAQLLGQIQRIFIEERNIRVDVSFYEDFVRESLLLRGKLMRGVEAGMTLTPAEIQMAARRLDRIGLDYVEVTPASATNEVAENAEGLAEFFKQHTRDYVIPPRMRVKHTLFTVADRIPSRIAEDDIRAYYDGHTSEFMPPPPTNTTPGAASPILPPLPFDQVREQAIAGAKRVKAFELAERDARRFADRISARRGGTPMTFEEAVTASNLTVTVTPPFAVGDVIPGVKAGPEFAAAAADLDLTPRNRTSRPVQGEEGYYVMALEEKIPEQIPPLESVKDRVTADYRAHLLEQATLARAQAVRKAASASNATLATVAQAQGLPLQSLTNFAPDLPAPTNVPPAHVMALRDAVRGIEEGGLTEPLELPGGARLVAQVKSRQPAGALEAQAGLQSAARAILSDQAERLRNAWTESAFEAAGAFDTLKTLREEQAQAMREMNR